MQSTIKMLSNKLLNYTLEINYMLPSKAQVLSYDVYDVVASFVRSYIVNLRSLLDVRFNAFNGFSWAPGYRRLQFMYQLYYLEQALFYGRIIPLVIWVNV